MKFKLTLEILIKNEVGQWFCQLGHVSFSKNVFWSINCTLHKFIKSRI